MAHCQRPVAETNWIIGSENLGRPNHVITCNSVLQHTSNTCNLNSNADGLNFFRRRALFGLLPVHAVAQESCLASQLAVGIPKMYESALLNCTSYICYILLYAYMSHVVTRTLDSTSTCKTHWSMVARSCTASRRSFTWETDGPKH